MADTNMDTDSHLKTLRTLKGDIADMMKENKISREALLKIDKKFEEQVEAYAATGADQNFTPPPPASEQKKTLAEALQQTQTTGEVQSAQAQSQKKDGAPVTREDIMKEIEKEFNPVPKQSTADKATPVASTYVPVGFKAEPTITSVPQTPTSTPASAPIVTAPIPQIKTPQEKVDEDIDNVKAKIDEIALKQNSLEEKVADIKNQQNGLRSSLEPIVSKEGEVEAEEQAIKADIERQNDAKGKRELEEKRWTLEDERHGTEKDRWEIEQKIAALDESINTTVKEQAEVQKQKSGYEQNLATLLKKKTALAALEEKTGVVKKLSDVKVLEKKLEGEWATIHAEYEKIETVLNQLIADEKKTETEIKNIETKEAGATTPAARHASEDERFAKEKSLEETEKKEWDSEENLKKTGSQIEDLQTKFEEARKEELSLAAKVKELDKLIAEGGIQA